MTTNGNYDLFIESIETLVQVKFDVEHAQVRSFTELLAQSMRSAAENVEVEEGREIQEICDALDFPQWEYSRVA